MGQRPLLNPFLCFVILPRKLTYSLKFNGWLRSDVFPIEIHSLFRGHSSVFRGCTVGSPHFFGVKIHSTPFNGAWITADLLGLAVLALAWTWWIPIIYGISGMGEKKIPPTKNMPHKTNTKIWPMTCWLGVFLFFFHFPLSDTDVATAQKTLESIHTHLGIDGSK